jgi:hypothetical protein
VQSLIVVSSSCEKSYMFVVLTKIVEEGNKWRGMFGAVATVKVALELHFVEPVTIIHSVCNLFAVNTYSSNRVKDLSLCTR